MPTYDYYCKKCDKIEEHYHSIKKTPKIKCKCGEEMQRLVGKGLPPQINTSNPYSGT